MLIPPMGIARKTGRESIDSIFAMFHPNFHLVILPSSINACSAFFLASLFDVPVHVYITSSSVLSTKYEIGL